MAEQLSLFQEFPLCRDMALFLLILILTGCINGKVLLSEAKGRNSIGLRPLNDIKGEGNIRISVSLCNSNELQKS